MRITICEDMDFYLAPIQQAIQHWMSVSGHTDVIVTVFKSSEDLLQRIETKFEEDLLFLDIQIKGEMNGIELAHKIRQLGLDTVIVFCTNFPQYVYEGYTVNALRFLPKPVSESDISYCCDYVLQSAPPSKIKIHLQSFLLANDMCYIITKFSTSKLVLIAFTFQRQSPSAPLKIKCKFI